MIKVRPTLRTRGTCSPPHRCSCVCSCPRGARLRRPLRLLAQPRTGSRAPLVAQLKRPRSRKAPPKRSRHCSRPSVTPPRSPGSPRRGSPPAPPASCSRNVTGGDAGRRRQRLVLEAFVETGRRARLGTWQVDAREEPAGWRIASIEDARIDRGPAPPAARYGRQFKATNLRVTAEDLELVLPTRQRVHRRRARRGDGRGPHRPRRDDLHAGLRSGARAGAALRRQHHAAHTVRRRVRPPEPR